MGDKEHAFSQSLVEHNLAFIQGSAQLPIGFSSRLVQLTEDNKIRLVVVPHATSTMGKFSSSTLTVTDQA
jgi:hypothetical protein